MSRMALGMSQEESSNMSTTLECMVCQKRIALELFEDHLNLCLSAQELSESYQNPLPIQNEVCPMCNKPFSITEIEKHVETHFEEMDNLPLYSSSEHNKPNSNLFNVSVEPIPSAPPLDENLFLEMLQKEAQEKEKILDEDHKLALILSESEKLPKSESFHYICQLCQSDKLESLYFLEACMHSFCRSCISKLFWEKVQNKKCSEIFCPFVHEDQSICKKPLLEIEIKEILGQNNFEIYQKTSLEELVLQSDSFVKCPNPKCTNIIECIKSDVISISSKTETDENGKPLSKEALFHREQFRFRCRECSTEFCSHCSAIPYHLGFTCQGFSTYQSTAHCRFCSAQLTERNHARDRHAIYDCCNEAECLEKRNLSCTKKLACGHPCGGIKNEKKCPPCLHENCAKTEQNVDSYCNICYVEGLGSAPAIQLECGHFFHHKCIFQKIQNKWTGSRITFGFLDCALCKKQMNHPSFKDDPIYREISGLQNVVAKKAEERLKALQLENSADIKNPKHPFYENPVGYAMWRFSYFPCFKCKKPYYGGERLCEGNNDAPFNPEELVCGGCSSFNANANCPQHGADYIEYKCRFCCNTAAWFCFGTTHFCEPCHKRASEVQKIPKSQLPPCTCKGQKHPVGEEFLFGCSLCRYILQEKQ